MKVFVVIRDAMGGMQYGGVHRARADIPPGEKTLEVNVIGDQADPRVVYIAETLDRVMDVHRFEGVYGDFETADRAAGEGGVVLNVNI